ncbi:MAG: hypothetical protein K2G10_04830, partial [Alistipes sp.]|nr:hypothetical protein [Alistipes sp.]
LREPHDRILGACFRLPRALRPESVVSERQRDERIMFLSKGVLSGTPFLNTAVRRSKFFSIFRPIFLRLPQKRLFLLSETTEFSNFRTFFPVLTLSFYLATAR